MQVIYLPWLLLLARGAFGQFGESTTPAECVAPCIDVTTLIGLSSMEPNATLFAEADVACGTPVSTLLQSTLTACIQDADVLSGCDCRSGAACSQALQAAFPEACRAAIIQVSCDNAFWFDEAVGVNTRNLYEHILNDCIPDVEPLTCDATVPAFDPAFCEGGAAPASAGAEAPLTGADAAASVTDGSADADADADAAVTDASADAAGETTSGDTASEDQANVETPAAARALFSGVAAAAVAVALLLAAAL